MCVIKFKSVGKDCSRRMKRFLVFAGLLMTCGVVSANGAVPPAFASWPKGQDPKSVGARIVAQFQATEPERYCPEGFDGERPGGKYVPYAVASLWVNAMEYALLTSQRNLKINLCEKFDPFLPGRKTGRARAFPPARALFLLRCRFSRLG